MAERGCLQPGEPVAADGAAEENRPLVADELAATAGEDRRQAGQARPVLLAAAGRGPSDAAGVQRDSAADLDAALAGGVSPGGYRTGRSDDEEKQGGMVERPRIAPKHAQVSGCTPPGKAYRRFFMGTGTACGECAAKTWSQSRRSPYTA